MLLKWSLLNILWVGSEQFGSVQGANCCLADISTTSPLPVWRVLVNASMTGRTKGASSDRMKTVSVSVIFSTRASKPGIFSMIALIVRTTLSRKARIGYICAMVLAGSKFGRPGRPIGGAEGACCGFDGVG